MGREGGRAGSFYAAMFRIINLNLAFQVIIKVLLPR